jgi:hypothetical protein
MGVHVLRNHRALRAFASFDQGRIADAFLGGDFDTMGEMLSALRLRSILTDRRWIRPDSGLLPLQGPATEIPSCAASRVKLRSRATARKTRRSPTS